MPSYKKICKKAAASLRAKKVVKELQNPQYRLATLERFRSKMFREPLETQIVKEGATILEKQDSEQERT